MQPETAQQRRPDPWPFGPVRGSDGPAEPSRAHLDARPAGPAPHPAAEPAALDAEAQADADALVARLRARRSASGVAAAYAAAHGHPADPRPEHGARRWALTGTTALVAVVAVLLLGVGVATFAMRGDGVESLAPLTEGVPSSGAGGTPGTFAGDGPEPLGTFAGDSPGPPGTGTSAGAGTGADGTAPADGGLLVHVVGEVTEPGLVTVPDGARVADALQAAGGATRKADLAALNLARTVVDGEQLYVPAPGEPVSGAPVAPGTGAPGGQHAGGDTIDINAADAVALEELPGVGPSIAQAIVEWRTANGPFASVDELEDVPGIGPATVDEIRDRARVGP